MAMRKPIDAKLVEKLARYGLAEHEIADCIGVAESTLRARARAALADPPGRRGHPDSRQLACSTSKSARASRRKNTRNAPPLTAVFPGFFAVFLAE